MLLIGTQTNQPESPVGLSLDGVLHHSLIVGQSGSGKSFLVARLVEELLLRTRARILIVDPNGDFRSIHRVNPKIWTEQQARFAELNSVAQALELETFDGQSAFEDQWGGRRFVYLSPGSSGSRDTDQVLHRKLFLHWQNLDEDTREFLLTADLARHSKLLLGLEAVQKNAHWLQVNRPDLPYDFDLRGMLKISESFANRNVSMAEYDYAKPLTTEDWFAVRAHISEVLKRYRLWSSGTGSSSSSGSLDLSEFIDGPFDASPSSPAYWDALSLTLDASREPDTLLSVDVALTRLWKRAKEAWRKRIESPDQGQDADARVPTFVVLDEAHNFAPRSPGDGIRSRVTERLLQFASEGRKYGLYLILATQRPTKLHPELVPECENSCVLRVQSKVEIEFASNVLGLPDNRAQVVSEFTRGQGLFSGRWIKTGGTMDTKVGPARTKVGGGGLGDEWAQLPGATPPYETREAVLSQIASLVEQTLREASAPVTLVALANVVSDQFGNAQPPDWLGTGGFKELLLELSIDHLELALDHPPGFAYLRGLHDPSQIEGGGIVRAQVADFAEDPDTERALAAAHRLTGLPLLYQDDYRAIIEALSQEVQQTEFNLSEVSKAVRDTLVSYGRPIGRNAINYVMKGIYISGHRYDSDLPQDPSTLADAFWYSQRGSVEGRVEFDADALTALQQHITGGLSEGGSALQSRDYGGDVGVESWSEWLKDSSEAN